MTTNEAITILEEVSLIDDSLYQYNEKYLEAFEMAIQALKNEKIDEDLITEIDKLPRIKVGNSNSPTVKYCIDEVLLYDLLENMPSVEKTAELQPIIRGKWLNVSKPIHDDYLGDVNFAECSVCHSIRVADYFCSCCGADMRKMKESGGRNE